MTQVRDAYHHGDLRNALVGSAVRLIEASGPGAFSLREAAREVGVSANAAYRHFDDKSALLTAVAADGFARLAERMRRAMESAERSRGKGLASVARFKAVGRAYVDFAVDHPALFRVMFGEHGAACRTEEPEDATTETPWTLLGQSLDALVVDGLLSPERRHGAELQAWSVVHGFASLAMDGLSGAASKRERAVALEALLQFAVVGLCGALRRELAEG
ncbi:MAG: TetR/AcrR family transcriptional regulator [Deltaproteobacteria bacterium]|nr:TetR/AcrR family transcriptional regulator [Deltaproteobacteria bacterium]